MESFENFFNEKLENFCKLMKSKNNDKINRNIEGLKLIYKIGGMKLFINSMLVPIEEKINDKNKEIFSLITSIDKIDEVYELFSEDERERVFCFIKFLLESKEFL